MPIQKDIHKKMGLQIRFGGMKMAALNSGSSIVVVLNQIDFRCESYHQRLSNNIVPTYSYIVRRT